MIVDIDIGSYMLNEYSLNVECCRPIPNFEIEKIITNDGIARHQLAIS